MHNQFANDCRRIGRQPELIGLDQAGAEPADHLSADSTARLDDVADALMQLPDQQRATLLLVALEGLSYAETARVLGVQTGTVMSRLHRAREHLRHLLDPLGDGSAAPAPVVGDVADPSPLRRIK
jgi:RNA polymerase sigma-70 factor (ECF subfamily)